VATKEIRVCDVFGIRKNVQRYRIVIRRIPETDPDLLDEAADEPALHLLDAEVDLSTRAVDRLTRFVQRGLTAPSGETAKDGAS